MSYKIIHTESKLMKRAYRAYAASTWHNLREAYSSCSDLKEESWKTCVSIMNELSGRDLKVIKKNTFYYSAGFIYTDENKNDHFVFITAENTREASLNYCLIPE